MAILGRARCAAPAAPRRCAAPAPWPLRSVRAAEIIPRIEKPPAPAPAQAPAQATLPSWAERAAGRIPTGQNPAKVVYGVVAVGALLAAESARPESHVDTISSALITVAVYWLAHAYANVLGERLASPARPTAMMLVGALRREWAIVEGAALPLLALVLAWLAGASVESALTAALWTVVGSLIGLELAAGIRSRASYGELALDMGIGLGLGLAILAVKLVLHH